MPSKPRFLCASKDDLIWQHLEEQSDQWYDSLLTSETYHAVAEFLRGFKEGTPVRMHPTTKGGYNVVFRLEYQDCSSVILRIPIKGVVAFPDEKVLCEVVTMRYIKDNTSIPVPRIYHYGTAAENPLGLGPFIVMEYIEHDRNMSRALLDPTRPIDERPVLNPEIDEDQLRFLYGQLASILLQLHSLTFPSIGCLLEESEGSVSVANHPMTINMNDLMVHIDMPASILPNKTGYTTKEEWYTAMADMHMAQLALQYNDATEDDDDTRDKYVARLLFRRLAMSGRLFPSRKTPPGQFRLFSQDLRPANILVDTSLRVVGVIDWEFAYAAPEEFTFDPPWCLLLRDPEDWEGGYREWMKAYEPQLNVFLSVLEEEERKSECKKAGSSEDRVTKVLLSQSMRESWSEGWWMVNYAARNSWAFDFIWWKFLDERYFGPNKDQDHTNGLELLSDTELKAMETLVSRKRRERMEKDLVSWKDRGAEAIGHITSLLI